MLPDPSVRVSAAALMDSTRSHEPRRTKEKSDYQEETYDAESAQVAKRWTHAMAKYGIEARGVSRAQRPWPIRDPNAEPVVSGILPVPPERRTDTQYSKIFFIWFSMNFNILSFVYCLLRGQLD